VNEPQNPYEAPKSDDTPDATRPAWKQLHPIQLIVLIVFGIFCVRFLLAVLGIGW